MIKIVIQMGGEDISTKLKNLNRAIDVNVRTIKASNVAIENFM